MGITKYPLGKTETVGRIVAENWIDLMPSIGKNIPHDSAAGHVSGQSIFLDDLPPTAGELLVDFLGSPVAHGKIRSIDLSAAAAIPGVILLTHKDIPGHNDVGPVMKDEHILAEEMVQFIGDPIVLVAAANRTLIDQAKKRFGWILRN
jgi:xanthine dehydrogenase large subunit